MVHAALFVSQHPVSGHASWNVTARAVKDCTVQSLVHSPLTFYSAKWRHEKKEEQHAAR